MKPTVKIVEVGPRDGLQNESNAISTDMKLALIQRLGACGLRHIEAGALVSPKWVPQMADTPQILQQLAMTGPINYPVLVPNEAGLETALAAGVQEIAIFGAASEQFSLTNINASIQDSLRRFAAVTRRALAAGIRVRGYISCVVGCPYEGPIAPNKVAEVATQLRDLGCYEISLGDTIGVGTPASVLRMLEAVNRSLPLVQLAGHFHNTYGMAISNIYACLQAGIRVFDASIAGLGGCPYAKGATGNVATEDVVYLLQGEGYETGVDGEALGHTAQWIRAQMSKNNLAIVKESDASNHKT